LVVPRGLMEDSAWVLLEPCSGLCGYVSHQISISLTCGLAVTPLLLCGLRRLRAHDILGQLLLLRFEHLLGDVEDLGVHLDRRLLQFAQVYVVPLLGSRDLGAVLDDAEDKLPDPVSLRGHLCNELKYLPFPHCQDPDKVQKLDRVDRVARLGPRQEVEDGLGMTVCLDLPAVA